MRILQCWRMRSYIYMWQRSHHPPYHSIFTSVDSHCQINLYTSLQSLRHFKPYPMPRHTNYLFFFKIMPFGLHIVKIHSRVFSPFALSGVKFFYAIYRKPGEQKRHGESVNIYTSLFCNKFLQLNGYQRKACDEISVWGPVGQVIAGHNGPYWDQRSLQSISIVSTNQTSRWGKEKERVSQDYAVGNIHVPTTQHCQMMTLNDYSLDKFRSM